MIGKKEKDALMTEDKDEGKRTNSPHSDSFWQLPKCIDIYFLSAYCNLVGFFVFPCSSMVQFVYIQHEISKRQRKGGREHGENEQKDRWIEEDRS
jgi:hypothetical protein